MNPAERVLKVVEHFNSWSLDKTVMEGWVQYLGVEGNEDGHHAVDVAVLAFQQEVRAVRRLLEDMGAPAHLFEGCSGKLRTGLSAQHLQQKWQGLHQTVANTEVFLALRWASWTLRDSSEAVVDDVVLQDLKEQLEAIEAQLREGGMSALMTETLGEIARAMRDALAKYKLQGVAPLQQAVRNAVGAINSSPIELRDEVKNGASGTKSVVAKVFKVVGDVAKATDDVVKIKKFSEGVYGWSSATLDSLSSMWPSFPALPGPISA